MNSSLINTEENRKSPRALDVVCSTLAPRLSTVFTALFSTLLLLAISASPVHAASSSWNVNASGNWTTSGNWTAGVPGDTTIDNADIATFSFTLTAGRAVTVDPTRYIGGIDFGNTSAFGYTLSTGILHLNNTGVIQTLAGNGNHTDTISSAIVLDGGSGSTATITAGATSASSILSIGAITGTAAAAGTTTLTLNGSNTGANIMSGVIGDGSGGGKLALVKDGTGAWTLNNIANTFTGGVTLNNGLLRLNSSSSFGNTTTSTVTINGGSIDAINAAGVTSANAEIWNGDFTVVGTFLWKATGTVTLGGNRTVTVLSSTMTTGVTTDRANSYSLTKAGAGTWDFGNSVNTFNGGLVIQEGTVKIQNSAALGAGTVTLGVAGDATSGTLDVFGKSATINSLATLGTAANQTITSSAVNGILNYTGATTSTFGGAITGGANMAVTVNNASANLTLSGTNTYTGNTTLTAGTLSVAADANLGGTNSLVFNGGTLQVTATTLTTFGSHTPTFTATKTVGLDISNAANTFTISQALNQTTGGLTKSGVGTLTLAGVNTYNGTTTVNAGTLELLSGASALTQTLGALTLAGADVTLKSNQSGAGTLSTTFTTLTARAAGNTANIVSSGGTPGTDNSIILTRAAGFIDKGVYFNGADFASMNATNTYVRALAYGTDPNAAAVDTILSGNHTKLTSTPGSQNSISLLSLNLSGSGVSWTNNASQTLTVPGIIKSGGGTQSTISGGSLTGGSNTELVIRTDTASDLLAISSNLTQGNGVLTKSGSGTLTLSGTNTFTGQTYVNGGTLSIGANVNLGTEATGAQLNLRGGTLQATNSFGLYNGSAGTNNRAVVLTGAAGFDVTGGNTLTVAGVVSGSGSLTKSGTGTQILSGTNTYTGTTTVTLGTLIIDGSLAATSSVSSAATLGGVGTINGLTTLSAADSILAPGTAGTTGTLTLAGGLTASSGGAFHFDMNGVAATDQINLGAGNLTAGGTWTFTLNNLSGSTVQTGIAYTLMSGTGSWTAAPTLAFGTLPSGWVLDAAYGGGSGYVWDTSSATRSFTVQFSANPEPSTLVLIGLGLTTVLLLRRRNS